MKILIFQRPGSSANRAADSNPTVQGEAQQQENQEKQSRKTLLKRGAAFNKAFNTPRSNKNSHFSTPGASVNCVADSNSGVQGEARGQENEEKQSKKTPLSPELPLESRGKTD